VKKCNFDSEKPGPHERILPALQRKRQKAEEAAEQASAELSHRPSDAASAAAALGHGGYGYMLPADYPAGLPMYPSHHAAYMGPVPPMLQQPAGHGGPPPGEAYGMMAELLPHHHPLFSTMPPAGFLHGGPPLQTAGGGQSGYTGVHPGVAAAAYPGWQQHYSVLHPQQMMPAGGGAAGVGAPPAAYSGGGATGAAVFAPVHYYPHAYFPPPRGQRGEAQVDEAFYAYTPAPELAPD